MAVELKQFIRAIVLWEFYIEDAEEADKKAQELSFSLFQSVAYSEFD